MVVLVPPYKVKGGLKLKEGEDMINWFKDTHVLRDLGVMYCKKPDSEVVEGKVHKGDDVELFCARQKFPHAKTW